MSYRISLYGLILSSILFQIASSKNWTVMKNESIIIPAHVYRVDLNKGEQLNLYLNTTANCSFTVYCYEQGKNILDDLQSFANFTYNKSRPYLGSFIPDKYTTYYIRVEAYSFKEHDDDTSNYKLQMFTNEYGYYLYVGILYKNDLKSQVIKLGVSKNYIFSYKIRFRYRTNSNLTQNVLLKTQKSPSFFSISQKQFCEIMFFPSQTWTLIIQYNLSTAYNLTSVNYTLQKIQNQACLYKCYQNTITSQDCTNNTVFSSNYDSTYSFVSPSIPQSPVPDTPKSQPNLAVIIPAIIVTAIVSIIIIKAICCRRKRRGQAPQIQIEQNIPRIPNSEQNLYSERRINQAICSICLNSNCNSSLPCNHDFHRQCIEMWLRKNKSCPVCRYQIRNYGEIH